MSSLPAVDDNATGQIERREKLGYAQFWRDFVAKQRPVIAAGAVKGWPALSKWEPEYLRSRAAGSMVNVGLSPTGVHDPYIKGSVKRMTFEEAVAQVLATGQTHHYYMMQVSIPAILPELGQDIAVPYLIEHETVTATNFWFGPGGNIAQLHYDKGHNLVAQVTGRKRVTLFDSRQLYCLYPFPALSPAPHVSRVNLQQPDLARFPSFRRARPFEGFLDPGDVLFIPVFWWHQFEGVDVNISVNFWWETPLMARLLSRQWARLTASVVLKTIRHSVRRAVHTALPGKH